MRRHTNELSPRNSNRERGYFAHSQLNIEVSQLNVSSNNRVEITCLATIPESVSAGEQYADYKTYSVKGKFLFSPSPLYY